MELIFKRIGNAWVGKTLTETFSFPDKKAGDVWQAMKETNPEIKIGFVASDIGPQTAYECACRGHGNVLWMR